MNDYKRSWKISAELPVEFTIKYSTRIFDTNNHDLLNSSTSARRLIVIDQTVYQLYGSEMLHYFKAFNVDVELCIIISNETTKVWDTVEKVLAFFDSAGVLRRSEPVIAIGGGVLLDLVGFCASIYRRGIPYIKVPTTLLAIVDASVGTKVAVNHFDRRNRIGAYYPPVASLLDKRFIHTQSEREIVNGLAEVFKMAIIKSAELFDILETNADQLIDEKFQYGAIPVRVINLSISEMTFELSPNLWEKELARCVDYGHSFSPIIEMKNLPDLLHGEAVALDCLLSACLGVHLGYLSSSDLDRIFQTAKNLRLQTFHPDFADIELLRAALSDTMKHRNGNCYLPIPHGIGDYLIINSLSDDKLLAAVKIFENYAN